MAGAARHDECAPFDDGVISQSEAQMLAKRLTDAKKRIEELERRVEEVEDAAGSFLIEAERFFDFANFTDFTADFDREVPGGLTDLSNTLTHLREVLANGASDEAEDNQ